jgi:hypothetical protein
MIEPLEGEAVQVNKVAWDLQFGKLPLPALEVLRACHPPVEQERGFVQIAAGVDQDMVGWDVNRTGDQSANCFLFLGTDLVARAELQEMLFDQRYILPDRLEVMISYRSEE